MQIRNLYLGADVSTILEALQTELRARGDNRLSSIKPQDGYAMLTCPYHKDGLEQHPSAKINNESGGFYCFACNKQGDLIDVITHLLGESGKSWLIEHFSASSSTNRKVSLLCSRLSPQYEDDGHDDDMHTKYSKYYIPKSELAQFRKIHPYILGRGIDREIIRKFDIGYDDKKNSITFPVKDKDGNVLYIIRRRVDRKYFNIPKDVPKTLYGIYEIYRELKHGVHIDRLYVVESMIDALSIWTYGKYAVALNGLGTLEQIEEINSLPIRGIVLATDKDNKGMKARLKLRKHLKNKLVYDLDYKGYGEYKDINEMPREVFENARLILPTTGIRATKRRSVNI